MHWRHVGNDLRTRSHTPVEAAPDGVDLIAAEAALMDDWLGLAGYLAEAVAAEEVTVDAARAELAAAATGINEREALGRAVEVAAAQFGGDAFISTMLRWATSHAARPAEAA
jgi:hypothetical protein